MSKNFSPVSNKHRTAIALINETPILKEAFNHLTQMKPVRIYAGLHAFGYRWNPITQTWSVPSNGTQTTPDETKRVEISKTPRKSDNTFWIRILAPTSQIGKIVADIVELAEAQDIVILTVGLPISNSGSWSRVNLKCWKDYAIKK